MTDLTKEQINDICAVIFDSSYQEKAHDVNSKFHQYIDFVYDLTLQKTFLDNL